MPEKRMGRPPGINYPVARTMLLTDEDFATLQRLAAAWSCSNVEAVRRMIREEGRNLDRIRRRMETKMRNYTQEELIEECIATHKSREQETANLGGLGKRPGPIILDAKYSLVGQALDDRLDQLKAELIRREPSPEKRHELLIRQRGYGGVLAFFAR